MFTWKLPVVANSAREMSQMECVHPGNFLLLRILQERYHRWNAFTLETSCCCEFCKRDVTDGMRSPWKLPVIANSAREMSQMESVHSCKLPVDVNSTREMSQMACSHSCKLPVIANSAREMSQMECVHLGDFLLLRILQERCHRWHAVTPANFLLL